MIQFHRHISSCHGGALINRAGEKDVVMDINCGDTNALEKFDG